jgi:hypothetical protein
MRLRTGLTVATLFLLCFTVAVWATPVDTGRRSEPDFE